MVPGFGFLAIERTARRVWLLSGGVGLALALGLGQGTLAAWPLVHLSRTWLLVQCGLVLAGLLGAFISLFRLSAIGVLAGLFFGTPVGVVTFFPSLWILALMLRRRRAFVEFGSLSGPIMTRELDRDVADD